MDVAAGWCMAVGLLSVVFGNRAATKYAGAAITIAALAAFGWVEYVK